MDQVETACYLRLQAVDRPGVLADITGILADQEISIEALLQKEAPAHADSVPIVILVNQVSEQRMNAALAAIQALDSIRAPATRIRVEYLDAD